MQEQLPGTPVSRTTQEQLSRREGAEFIFIRWRHRRYLKNNKFFSVPPRLCGEKLLFFQFYTAACHVY